MSNPSNRRPINPYLAELKRLTESEDPADERQFRRMYYLAHLDISARIAEVQLALEEIKHASARYEARLQEVSGHGGRIETLEEDRDAHDGRITALESYRDYYPSLLFLSRQHPVATVVIAVAILGFLAWFLSLPPEAREGFFGLFG